MIKIQRILVPLDLSDYADSVHVDGSRATLLVPKSDTARVTGRLLADQQRPVLHPAQKIGVDKAAVVRRLGAVQADDVRLAEQLRTLRGHSGWIASVDFSPDGRVIAAGCHSLG